MATAKKLPSGNWRSRAFLGTGKDGKKKYKSFTAATKKEAEYLAAEYLAKHRIDDAEQADITLSQAYSKYIEIKQNTLSPATVREYTRASKSDFPMLMPLKLSKITQVAVQNAVNIMAGNHSPKSVRNAHGLLSAVLTMFAPDIRLNTRLPQANRPDIYVPTEAEIEMLIADIKNENLRKAVLLAAFGSLRRSECCALTADDINGNIISVNKALVRDVHKQWVLKPPKSKAGYRDIKMPQFVIEMLTPAENGRIVNIAPVTLTDYFMALRNKHGLPNLRFHDLRHYQASILHAMGVPDKYIMERGGWSTDSTLKNIYQHTMSDKRNQVEDEIIKRFEEYHAGYVDDTPDDTNARK